MATDQLNTPQAPDREDSPATNNVGSIDSYNNPKYRPPYNSRLEWCDFIELDEAGVPVEFKEFVDNEDVVNNILSFYRAFLFRVNKLKDNLDWTTLLNHFPIEALDRALPYSPFYNPYISFTDYVTIAARIYGMRYGNALYHFPYEYPGLAISLLAYNLGEKIIDTDPFGCYYNKKDTYIIGKRVMHLILIIVEYFRMRVEDEIDVCREKDFDDNPEIGALWNICIGFLGDPVKVSINKRLCQSVFDPFYLDIPISKSPFGSWHNVLITPIRMIVEKLFSDDGEKGPYKQLYNALTLRIWSNDEGLSNTRLIGFLQNSQEPPLTTELYLIILFFHMYCINDNRRHIIKDNMKDSTKFLIKDLEEICETILKYKSNSLRVFADIEQFNNIQNFTKALRTEYYLSHLDEEIEPIKASFSAFEQTDYLLVSPDFEVLPDYYEDEPWLIDGYRWVDYFRLKENDWQHRENDCQPDSSTEAFVHTNGAYRCPFEITEPFYYEFDLDYSSCLGDFEDNFYERYAAIDKDRRSLEIRFSELVNWFAQNGVIKNELKVLNLFAYRLTGMGEKPKELPKIEIPIKIDASHKEAYWTLIYLAKTLYQKNTTRNKDPQNRGIYPKLADFFVVTDPEHPEVAKKNQQDFENIVNSSTVDGKQKNPSALVKGKVPDSLVKLIKNNFGLPKEKKTRTKK